MLRTLVLLAWIPFTWQPLWGQSPGIRKDVTQEPKQKAKLTTAQPQIGTEASPFIVESHPRPESQEEATKAKADKEHATCIERWTLGFTGAAALFTGLLVVVGRRGVDAAIRTLRAIEKQTKANISAARTARRTLLVAYRPWIGADSLELKSPLIYPPRARFLLHVRMTLRNTGTSVALDGLLVPYAIPDHTPAMPGNIKRCWEQTEEIMRTKQESTPWETGFVLNPGSSIEIQAYMGSDDITPHQVHGNNFYVIGCIIYRDQFGKYHRTQCCFRPTVLLADASKIEFLASPWLQKAD